MGTIGAIFTHPSAPHYEQRSLATKVVGLPKPPAVPMERHIRHPARLQLRGPGPLAKVYWAGFA